jgi:hypothetical protein
MPIGEQVEEEGRKLSRDRSRRHGYATGPSRRLTANASSFGSSRRIVIKITIHRSLSAVLV